MKNNSSLIYALILVIGDFLALLAAFIIAYVIRVKLDPRPLLEQIPALTFIKLFLVVLPLWILVHGFIGLYSQSVYDKRFSELGRLMVGSFIGILVVIGYDFVSAEELFPARLVPVYGLILGFLLLVVFRTLARYIKKALYKYNYGVNNVLVIGDTEATTKLCGVMSNTAVSGMRLLGTVGKKAPGINNYSSFQDALSSLKRPIHSIVQTELYPNHDRNNDILKYAQENHVAYRFVPGNSDLFVGNIEVELFAGLPVVAVHQTALIGWGRFVKRIFDLVVSTTLLFFLWPLLLLLALIIKLFDPKGPVFFRQTRLTRFNQPFKVYKFRTHRASISGLSDKKAFEKLGKPHLYDKYVASGYALNKDPRVSPIGRFLRKSSLDELPQLFNVLVGDISLVGPRALIPEELNTYEKRHAILSVKSGLTGLAQISGREDISFEERRSLDIYYVQNWSFWWDIVILIKTVFVVLFGKGAK